MHILTNKRICMSFGCLSSGGIGIVMLNLASAFIEYGAEVDFLFTQTNHSGRERKIPAEVNIYNLSSRTRHALPKVIFYLKKRKPELIITARNNVSILMLLARRFACRDSSSRIICTFHTSRTHALQHGGWQSRLYDLIAMKLYRWADELVAVSCGVAREIESSLAVSRGTVKVIYNPIWTENMLQEALSSTGEDWLEHRKFPVLISAGRLTAEKNFMLLLQAFKEINETTPSRLIILGEGEQREQLQNFVFQHDLSDCVKMPGHVANPLAYFSRANLFVLTSAWEGFGNVLVEAMACGLPIVSTDCPYGPSEILANGQYGELVPVGDQDGLVAAIKRVLKNPPDSQRQKIAAERFSIKNSADAYISLGF